jgi:hypothetical protein
MEVTVNFDQKSIASRAKVVSEHPKDRRRNDVQRTGIHFPAP